MTATVAPARPSTRALLLLGNPNAGKTSLFNRLCGARARTANYPGITADARIGRGPECGGSPLRVVDLPGVYSLDLPSAESEIVRQAMDGDLESEAQSAVVVVADATNLARHLRLALEARARGRRVILALNMIDRAEATGLRIDVDRLAERLGAPVIPMDARRGRGIDALLHAVAVLDDAAPPNAGPGGDLAERAEAIAAEVVDESERRPAGVTARVDRALLHPVIGTLTFIFVMALVFASLFEVASYPMEWIEIGFASLGSSVRSIVPEGAFADLLVDGVIGGVAGTVVFLPQIALLFFFLTLLEDTGYLARAALVVDRLMRRFGLPGHAFVPLLSAHACALPGILCTRLIPNRRDRLATILVAPFMSCSARLPVYAMLTGLLFPDDALRAGLAFAGCYALGGLAALITAWVARGTLLRGTAHPMALELPSYKSPSLRNAVLTAYDRSRVFLVKAGTVIVCICVVLWWLSSYPGSDPTAEAEGIRARAASIETVNPAAAEEMMAEAEGIDARHSLRESFAGRIGVAGETVLAPIGADWRISIAVVSSFAAREVFVSTMMVVIGQDEEADPGEARVLDRVRTATRDDGTALFSRRAAVSLLVFYVLALQCLPTLAVTRREAGGWSWALLQFAWMSGLAWVLAFATYAGLGAIGWT